MSDDIDGFFSKLPPDVQGLLESLDKPRAKPGGRAPATLPVRSRAGAPATGASFSTIEEEILGFGDSDLETQEEDRMFESPAEELPAPKPRARKSMSEMIEAMERNRR